MRRFFAFCCLMLIAGNTHAALQSIPSIQQAVKSFVAGQTANLPGEVEIEVGEIDPRLSLPECPNLVPFLAEGSKLWGNSTVGVKCENQWSIYVPVRIRVMAPVVVSTRPLAQGMVIGPPDVMLRKEDLAQASGGILTKLNDALGKTMRTGIPSGYPLSMNMLRAPLIIQQGQSVKLVSKGTGFQVTSDGIALGSASEGQTVQVRTPSGHIVSGTARAGPIVEVQF